MKIKLIELRHPSNTVYSIRCLRNICGITIGEAKKLIWDNLHPAAIVPAPAFISIDKQLGYLDLQDLDEWFQFEIIDTPKSNLKLWSVTTERGNPDMSFTVRKFLILAVTETDAVNQAIKEADTTLAINSEEVKGPFVNKEVLGEFIV